MARNACLVVKANYVSGCHKKTLEKQALLAGSKKACGHQGRQAYKAARLTIQG
jgi:hypothetical protein